MNGDCWPSQCHICIAEDAVIEVDDAEGDEGGPRMNDCCRPCRTCNYTVHLGGVWPPNVCLHGDAVCEDCAPGDCVECATELAERMAS